LNRTSSQGGYRLAVAARRVHVDDVGAEEETEGLDLSLHDERGYNL
jgi:hypothetical protein